MARATWSTCASSTARRRDVMLEALAEHFGERAQLDAARRAACSSGRRSTSASTRPTCSRWREDRGRRVRAGPRRLHGRPPRRLLDAPELRGRARATDIREGIAPHRQGDARAARPARHAHGRARAGRAAGAADAAGRRATRPSRWPTCVELPRRDATATRSGDAGDGRIDERRSRGGGAEGRPLARARRLAALGRARAGRAAAARTRGASRSTPGPELVARAAASCEPDAAFIALHGGDGEDGTVQALLEAIGIPYTGSGPAACMRCTDKVLAKHLMREAGIPTPALPRASPRASIQELGRGAALRGVERDARLPARRQAGAAGGSALGVKFARSSERAARRDRRRVLLRPHGADRALRRGRDLAVSVLDRRARRRARWRCRSSRRSRARRTSTTTSRATRSA